MAILGKTRRQALTEFREAEILEAARKVFSEQGYGAATVDHIAAAAGVAKGTIYLYYDSKEAIFWAALSSRFREMFERTKLAMAAESTTRAKLRAGLRVRFEFFRSDEQFVRMFISEFGHMCRNQGGPMHALYLESAETLASVIRDGIAAGELRQVPALETAMALMDLVKSVFAMRFTGLRGQQPDFDGEQFVFDLFWRGVEKAGDRA